MAVIRADGTNVVLINVFTVDPDRADRLVALLDEATERTMRHRPGFISANIHRALDGTKVVNYAQWRSRDEFEAMMNDPAAREHMGAAAELATRFEPALYEVRSVHDAAG